MLKTQDYYRHHENRVINNRVQEYKIFMDVGHKEHEHPSLNEPHRMHKQHPFDCGIPGCVHCHPEKLEKRRYKLTGAELDKLLDEYDITL